MKTQVNFDALGGGGTETPLLQQAEVFNIGDEKTVPADCSLVVVEYRYAGSDPQNYMTIDSKSCDAYFTSTNMTVMYFTNVKKGAIMKFSSGSWTVVISYSNS